jgi:hypothetical protein
MEIIRSFFATAFKKSIPLRNTCVDSTQPPLLWLPASAASSMRHVGGTPHECESGSAYEERPNPRKPAHHMTAARLLSALISSTFSPLREIRLDLNGNRLDSKGLWLPMRLIQSRFPKSEYQVRKGLQAGLAASNWWAWRALGAADRAAHRSLRRVWRSEASRGPRARWRRDCL